MKGRNSSCINIRLDLEDIRLLTERASSKGFETPGQYVKATLLKSLHSGSTFNGYSDSTIPIYNPSLHKAGDRVLVRQGKKLVEQIVPELDADGQPILDP